MVHADPMTVNRRLVHSLNGAVNQTLQDTRSLIEETKFEATEKLLKSVVYAFELVPLDRATGLGVTETECIDLLNSFLSWRDDQKKSIENSQTGSEPTGSPPPSTSTTTPG